MTTPSAAASFFRYVVQSSPLSLRTIVRRAALASSVVESTPTVSPRSSVFAAAIRRTNSKTCSLTVAGSRWPIFVRLE
jgi:hypothetical protein